jgi:ChpA-C
VLKKFAAAGIITAATAGVMMLGAPANADVDTSGAGGVLSGNQFNVPVNVCGNNISLVNVLDKATCNDGASVNRRDYHPINRPLGY